MFAEKDTIATISFFNKLGGNNSSFFLLATGKNTIPFKNIIKTAFKTGSKIESTVAQMS